ncbi:type II toxin-antitoxin system PemK/MazF family toxin [Ancylothrix sp. C2]|uniref:type II toxin-antitoxin system PemK/MazF family toxin n=1 Tax=Ancylothrix sp. D3o TaxID=2953691 RepID=UPI0021BB5387|nr:type II toxin-antitoxin system PemK/MazF family toxin [Ancylothrix sp. D3o]MCT7950786.1 type II toxin-antitoxin system PemK/MazF family toxin [Ancylothrix sp. D3o]
MIKGKIVLVDFPFDDLSATKLRPVLCLTNPVGKYEHILFAIITSKIPSDLMETDIVLNSSHPDFASSGLHKESTLRLDHLITLRKSMIRRELGVLSPDTQTLIADKLCNFLKS